MKVEARCNHIWVANSGKGGEPVYRENRMMWSSERMHVKCSKCPVITLMSKEEWESLTEKQDDKAAPERGVFAEKEDLPKDHPDGYVDKPKTSFEVTLQRALQIFAIYTKHDRTYIPCALDPDGLIINVDPKFMSEEHYEELKQMGFSQEHNYFIFYNS